MEACAAIVGDIVSRLGMRSRKTCGASVRRSVSCKGNWSVPCVSIQLTLSQNLSLFQLNISTRHAMLPAASPESFAGVASHVLNSGLPLEDGQQWRPRPRCFRRHRRRCHRHLRQ